jgi:hypothetical protein
MYECACSTIECHQTMCLSLERGWSPKRPWRRTEWYPASPPSIGAPIWNDESALTVSLRLERAFPSLHEAGPSTSRRSPTTVLSHLLQPAASSSSVSKSPTGGDLTANHNPHSPRRTIPRHPACRIACWGFQCQRRRFLWDGRGGGERTVRDQQISAGEDRIE